jgi:UDP-glucose 4-epimerase
LAQVLLTGGTGYIGSHACVALIQAGYEPIVVDNLCNSNAIVLDRVARITGHLPVFYHADLRDAAALERIFGKHELVAVMHFAGLKAVAESVAHPDRYYDNNVLGSRTLCAAMSRAGIKRMIFSSSATVYGEADSPIPESTPIAPANPYGETKATIEGELEDLHAADSSWQIGTLRYFNPVGAHESGLIGEDPRAVPENLVPFIAQVAVGRRTDLHVYGNDYPTADGTGVRDYIHVMDLVEGHLRAMDYLVRGSGSFTVNLGTGRGYSVLEVVRTFEKASGRTIPCRFAPRRPGDVAISYADVKKAGQLLGWNARRSLGEMCADVWRWQEKNPNGYGG